MITSPHSDARRSGVRAGIRLAICLVLSVGLGGCDVHTDNKMTGQLSTEVVMRLDGPITMSMQGPVIKYSGVYVSQGLLDLVELNVTRTDWLIAVFGEPTSRATLGDATEIWKWSYTPLEQQANVLSFFGSGKDEPKPQPWTVFIRLRDGIVTQKWHS